MTVSWARASGTDLGRLGFQRIALWKCVLAAAALVVVVACGADGAPAEPAWDDERVVREILQPSCGISACHAQPEPAAGLVLDTTEGMQRSAVGRPPVTGTAARAYPAIIQPGAAEQSFLIAKVTRPGVDEGLPMPPNDWMLSEDAVEVLRRWIEQMGDGS